MHWLPMLGQDKRSELLLCGKCETIELSSNDLFPCVLVRPSSYSPKNAAKAKSGPEACLFFKGHIAIFCLTFTNF